MQKGNSRDGIGSQLSDRHLLFTLCKVSFCNVARMPSMLGLISKLANITAELCRTINVLSRFCAVIQCRLVESRWFVNETAHKNSFLNVF